MAQEMVYVPGWLKKRGVASDRAMIRRERII